MNDGSGRLHIDYTKELINIYGDEDQNELMQEIKKHREDDDMEVNEIEQISRDIEIYKEAIEDAQNALAAAEKELDAALEAEIGSQYD